MAITALNFAISNPTPFTGSFNGTSTYSASTTWFVGIEGPEGTIKELDTGSPDDTGTNASVVILGTSNFVDGKYTFTVTVWPDNDNLQAVTETYEFCYEPTRTLTINVTDDCKDLRIEDATTYPTTVSLTRSITVRYPSIAGISTPSDFTTAAQLTNLSMAQPDGNVYEFVTWVVIADSTGTFRETSGFFQIVYPITYTQYLENYEVICNLDLCQAIDCVNAWWQKQLDKACQVGGISKLPLSVQDQITELIGNLSLYAHYVNCGDQTNARIYYEAIKDITKSVCTPDESPKAIVVSTPDGVWNEIPSGNYDNSFAPASGNALAWRLSGKVVFFKGAFVGPVYQQAGSILIEGAYFDAQGIKFIDGVSAPIMDGTLSGGTPTYAWGFVRPDASNNINVHGFMVAAANDQFISGTLLIE